VSRNFASLRGNYLFSKR